MVILTSPNFLTVDTQDYFLTSLPTSKFVCLRTTQQKNRCSSMNPLNCMKKYEFSAVLEQTMLRFTMIYNAEAVLENDLCSNLCLHHVAW